MINLLNFVYKIYAIKLNGTPVSFMLNSFKKILTKIYHRHKSFQQEVTEMVLNLEAMVTDVYP